MWWNIQLILCFYYPYLCSWTFQYYDRGLYYGLIGKTCIFKSALLFYLPLNITTQKQILSEAFKAKPAKYEGLFFRHIVKEGDVFKFQFLKLTCDERWVEGNYFEKPATKAHLTLMECPWLYKDYIFIV